MDWIPKDDKPYKCSITERERSLKARSEAKQANKPYHPTANHSHHHSSTSVPKGGLDWVPAGERVSRGGAHHGTKKVNHGAHHGAKKGDHAEKKGISGPQGGGFTFLANTHSEGLHNVHRGMDWIPNHEKRDPHAYDHENPDGKSHGGDDEGHAHHSSKKGDAGFDWVPDNERATGVGSDAIIGGSLGGGWNAQFIIKRDSYRKAKHAPKSAGHAAKPYKKAAKSRSAAPDNPYNMSKDRPGGHDLWSGVSENYGAQPLW